MTGVLVRRDEDMNTQRVSRPYEGTGRRQTQEISLRKTNPANILILDSSLQNCKKIYIFDIETIQFVVVCHGSPRKTNVVVFILLHMSVVCQILPVRGITFQAFPALCARVQSSFTIRSQPSKVSCKSCF